MTMAIEDFLARRVDRSARAIPLSTPVPIGDLPTPALVVDVDALERNLDAMADFLGERGVGLRPHAKMHKCFEVSARQLARGAVGICVAKPSEAEVLFHAGIDRILVTSPIVSDGAIARFVALVAAARASETADLRLVVDDAGVVAGIGAQATAAGVDVALVVDLDPDMGRTGIARGAPALDLVRTIAATSGVRFGGLQQYSGQLQHLQAQAAREEGARAALAAGRETAMMCEADGHAVEIFTGGGTGTFDIDCEPLADLGGFTDLQCGSYAFMDEEYGAIGHGNGERFDAFEPALSVVATAISRPRQGAITIDAGLKSFASDTSKPVALAPGGGTLEGVRYRFGGDEHGILLLREGAPDLAVGDRLRFVTPHCDPTVNLYDWIYAARGDQVQEIWPVAARGCSW